MSDSDEVKPKFGDSVGNPAGTAIGRIVHFVLANGEHRAATVVRVWPECVNLHVHLDGTNDRAEDLGSCVRHDTMSAWATSAHFSQEPKPGTWHLPERV